MAVPLYEIVDPDGVRSSILAPTPMMALRAFHAEGFGGAATCASSTAGWCSGAGLTSSWSLVNGTSCSKA